MNICKNATKNPIANILLTGQLVKATAPANWTRSPALIVLCFCMKGIRLLTLSSIPLLAEKLGSTVGKRSIEPSAPPPLYRSNNLVLDAPPVEKRGEKLTLWDLGFD